MKNKRVSHIILGYSFIFICHDKHFVFKGTKDMVEEYHNYWFHIKGFFIGELIALAICTISGLIIQFIL